MRETDTDFVQIHSDLLKYGQMPKGTEKRELEHKIIIAAVPLVKKITVHLARRSTDPIEDIMQVGILGLIKAVKLFDGKVSSNFRTYATYFITGEIRHYLRDKASMIKAPREIYELAYRVNKIIAEFRDSDGTLPSENKLAEELKTPVGKIREVMDIERRRHIISLDQILSYIDADGQPLSEKIPNDNYNFEISYQEDKIMIAEAMKKLDNNLREVVELNFFNDVSQTKIAEKLGISQMQVSRRIKKALKKLLELIDEERKSYS